MQMFPMALVCGNTMIMKPSEQDPGACMMLVKLAKEAGVPDGCVNVIHGTHDCESTFCTFQFRFLFPAVNFICDNPDIHAISFVGSDIAVSYKIRICLNKDLQFFLKGKHIYERGGKNGKRVQSNMGAKNHGVIMPDANKESTLNQVGN
jgi:malonate-semialdehyde dehydrogenase (acetylating)/methylmalonate-semialdehyde dehydrogenase